MEKGSGKGIFGRQNWKKRWFHGQYPALLYKEEKGESKISGEIKFTDFKRLVPFLKTQDEGDVENGFAVELQPTQGATLSFAK